MKETQEMSIRPAATTATVSGDIFNKFLGGASTKVQSLAIVFNLPQFGDARAKEVNKHFITIACLHHYYSL